MPVRFAATLAAALFLIGCGGRPADHGRSAAAIEAAVRLSPGLPKAHFGIGVLMEAAGRDREAIKQFSAAVKSDPSYVEARMQLADALRREGLVADSLPHYEEIVRVNPSVSQAVFGHAMALVRLARYQEASGRLAEGVNSYADQPGFAHALARAKARRAQPIARG